MDCQLFKRMLLCIALLCVLSFRSTVLLAEDPQSAAATASPVSARKSEQPETPASAIVRAMRNDAALNDIFFIAPSTGWAAGDRGVIWHTEDGGATWREQSANTTCNLSSIFFVDAQHGWAGGGECLQGRAATRGIVLRTDDGGKSWTPLPHLVLPTLAGVKFFDRNRGIAFGDSASYDPSGVFATRDGGNTWQPLPTDKTGNWFAGDFLAPTSAPSRVRPANSRRSNAQRSSTPP